jgi:NAD(P)-dependent dehydrogenase (short-subunit alcohol dehydrogenase family)
MKEECEEQVQRMKGKRVLVTGSGTGIGRSMGLEFAREGAVVAFHYAYHGDGAQAAVEQVLRLGGKAAAFKGDFRQPDSTRHLADQALEFLSGIDVLVNNAGISLNVPFEEVTPEQFDILYNVNFRAVFFLTQSIIPNMLMQGHGVILNIASIHAFGGVQEYSVYAATKGAMVAFTRQLAIELAPKGIRVNGIAPGVVEVENYYEVIPDFNPQAFGRNIPVGFVGQPRDIARAAVFLASDDARFIVGQTLVVDGGTTSWFAFRDDFRKPLTARWGKGYVPGR